jgi:hypothetical protein
MPIVPDDVTATDLPYSVGLFLIALVALVSCNRESPDGPPSASDKTNEAAQGHPTAPVWVVDPQDPGSNLPPVGRSLFDYLVTAQEGARTVYKVPFPFTALVNTIEEQVGADAHRSPLKRVLIPLNRSLQRHAARPEFFKYPRAVLGVDTEPPLQASSSGLLLKDRLFLGYQEKANIIEVISYNEAAGRFEFQVVRDYRPGGNPTVLYANRAVCTVCHQNQSPIFARPLWDETNANPTIAALLQEQRRDFYQFPIQQGIDVPSALDDATDRANEFSAAQVLWQEGCERAASQSESIRCRADLVRFLLQYRLSGSRGLDTRSARFADQFAPRFLGDWQAKWPQGLLIPNPDILNRNPLDFFQPSRPRGMGRVQMISSDDGRDRLAFRAVFEPSVPRGPIATWSAAQGLESVHRVIISLSNFVAEADMRRLDAHLFQQTSDSGHSERRYEAACRFSPRWRARSIERLTFRCVQPKRRTDGFDGSAAMEGVIYVSAGKVKNGAIDHLAFSDGDDLTDLEIVRGEVTEKRQQVNGRLEVTQQIVPLHARRTDGNAVKEITFHVEGTGERSRQGHLPGDDSGHATVMVLNDFGAVHQAIDRMASETLSGASDVLARKPFRRAPVMKALYEHLNMPRLKWCCVDIEGMPDAVADVAIPPDVGRPAADEGETIPAIKAFRQYCARCHQGEDTFPPNFLHGSAREVQAQVNHCAERIFFRLEMWGLRASDRPETPMPPVNALRRLSIAPEHWATHADLAVLKNYATEVLKAVGDKPPRLEDLVAQGYDNLRECLPTSQD